MPAGSKSESTLSALSTERTERSRAAADVPWRAAVREKSAAIVDALPLSEIWRTRSPVISIVRRLYTTSTEPSILTEDTTLILSVPAPESTAHELTVARSSSPT